MAGELRPESGRGLVSAPRNSGYLSPRELRAVTLPLRGFCRAFSPVSLVVYTESFVTPSVTFRAYFGAPHCCSFYLFIFMSQLWKNSLVS